MASAKENTVQPQNTNSLAVTFGKTKYFLRRYFFLFSIVAIVAGLGGLAFSIFQKPKYKSHLSFALDDQAGSGGGLGNLIGLASQFGFNIGDSRDIFSGENILQILKSRRMIEQVMLSVDTFENKPYTFIEYYLQLNRFNTTIPRARQIHFPVGSVKSRLTYQQDSILYKVYKNFSEHDLVAQKPDKKVGIYEVSVTSGDEKFTKDLTDRLIAATNAFYVDIRTAKAKQTLDVLQERVNAMKSNLSSSISQKATVQDINVNPALSEGQVPVQKQQANIQVYGTAYAEMFKNLELARFQYLNEIPLMQIIDAANYPMEKLKWGKLKSIVVFVFVAELLALLILLALKYFSQEKPS